MRSSKTLVLAAATVVGLVGPASGWQATVYDNHDCNLDSATSYFTYNGGGQSPCVTVGNNTQGGNVGCFYTTHSFGGLACGDGSAETADTYALWLTGFAAEKEVSISVPDGTECKYCYTRGAFSCVIGDGGNCRSFTAGCMPLAELAWNNFNTIQMTCKDV